MRNYIVITLLFSILIASSQLNAKTDYVAEDLFNDFDKTGKINTDKFVDAMGNNDIDVYNEKIVEFLETLTKTDLQMIRNTFFAKHGYIFKTRELQNYFNHKEWYVPQNSHVALPANEEKIVSFIQKIENCENVKFDQFHKLFTPLSLPVTYGNHTKSKRISMINVRKFLNMNTTYLPYYAIGELYNNKFIVLLYQTDSIETQPHIATFSVNGKLISDKAFFSIGGDMTSYADGKLVIERELNDSC